MLMETLGNSGIVASGGAGIQPMIDLMGGRNNYGCNDGFGGGNGIWAILLLALLGRRGFGDDGGNCNNNGVSGGAVPLLLNDNNNKNFQALQGSIQAGDATTLAAIQQQGIVEAVRAVDANVCAGFLQTANGFAQTRLDSCAQTGTINQNVNEVKFQGAVNTGLINSNIAENRFQAALEAQRTQAQIADCCCSTQMQIMESRFQAEKNTCDIIAAQTAGTQRVLDKLNCNEIQDLRDKLQNERFSNSQLMQNATLINALRPYPNPCVPVGSPVSPLFPCHPSLGSPCGGFGSNCGIL